MIHFKKQTEKWFKIQFLFKKTPKLIFFKYAKNWFKNKPVLLKNQLSETKPVLNRSETALKNKLIFIKMVFIN
jgi:hypothetical protein